jgi:hypothetical protein
MLKKIKYGYSLKKYIKWGCLEGSGVPVLYIGRTVSKGIHTAGCKLYT